MTVSEKDEIINMISGVLDKYISCNDIPIPKKEDCQPKKIEMLTIKECVEEIKGLTDHTIRKLVAQNKVKYIRTGQGKRGKILIKKDDLINLFS